MDFEQNNNSTEPLQPQPTRAAFGFGQGTQTPKKHSGWKIFWGIFLGLSVLANIALFLMMVGMVAVFAATGQKSVFVEEVIQTGPRMTKIAVVNVQGIIDSEQAQDVYKQIKSARQDRRIKGLILRVNSPGGTISGSDQICNEIRKFRKEEDKPVVAFMQGVAASGGYYVSVGCDKIVAEPTVITGSIGVIAGHFVLKGLLEEKLGIQPAIFKSGEKKDWPSSFQPVTEEQRKYIQDRLINPAYSRFVQVVAEGRAEALTLDDVKRLADGSIYGAEEALNENLIDRIGYIDDAIEEVKSLAGIEKAQVIEYRKPFSLAYLLSSRSKNILRIDKSALYELSTLQILYLWSL
ncbi:MAG: signal peptide peptidase SppA [Sedimentisphaerales bacterium]|nr:signal peptide peptidase SppA [Sedimentisphaerales bacterium]